MESWTKLYLRNRETLVDCEITIKGGKSRGKRFTVKEGTRVTLGRGMQADVQVFDDGLSRLHCAFENRGESLVVTDLGSANGTYVNGKPVASAAVYDGDEVVIGVAVLSVSGPPRPVHRDNTPLPIRSPAQLAEADVARAAGASGSKDHTTELVRKVDPSAAGMLKSADGAAENQLRRAHRDLVTLYRVVNTINALRDPRELASTIAQTVIDVTKADRVAVLVGKGPEAALNPVASRERGKEGDVANFAVSRTVVTDVLRRGVSVLSRNVPKDERYAAGQSLIMQRVQSMMCVPLLAQGEIVGALYVDSRGDPNAFDEQDLELMAAIGNQAGVALKRAQLVQDLENLFFSSIRSLVAAIDAKDRYTHGHSERVTTFALRLAKEIDLPEHERDILQLAGLLHDVGKIGVPEWVLNKPGELTDDEFALVMRHPVHGAEIISNIQSPHVPEVAASVLHHHERWDGSGYPGGLKGEESPRVARILALADAFDAMTSDRPYRKGYEMEQAARVVRDCSGTQFDPAVVEVFWRLHERGELVLPQTMALKYTTSATPKVV